LVAIFDCIFLKGTQFIHDRVPLTLSSLIILALQSIYKFNPSIHRYVSNHTIKTVHIMVTKIMVCSAHDEVEAPLWKW